MLYGLRISLLRGLRQPGRLAALLIFPAAVLLAGLLLPREALARPVEVGLCRPAEPSPAADALCALLLEERQGYVRFVESDPAEARDRVAAGEWDCAFLLADGFEGALEAGGRPVVLLESRGSVLSGLAREAVAAALLRVRAANLAGEYLARSGLLPDPVAAARRAAGLLRNDRPMTVVRLTGGETPGKALPETAAAPLVRGGAALLLLCCALTGGAALRRTRRTPWFIRAAGPAGEAGLLPLLLLEQAGPPLAACVLAVAAAQRLLPGFHPLGRELAALLLYQLALLPLTLLCARLPGAEELTPAALPYVTAACVLLCPILFDAGRLVDGLEPVCRLLPPTWYLRESGDGAALLWKGCALSWAIALAAEAFAGHGLGRRRGKRG